MSGRRAVFLDRDGTINLEKDYLADPDELEWIDGAPQAIRRLNDTGWLVVVVTNQAGVARGYFEEKDVRAFHEYMSKKLEAHHAHIDAYYYCPYHPHGVKSKYAKTSHDRKPSPGMFERAIAEHDIDASASYTIGDKNTDIDAGRAAGTRTILVRTGYGASAVFATEADHVVDDLTAAVDLITRQEP